MSELVKIAAVQMQPGLMQTGENRRNACRAVEAAAGNRARLVVFPECTLSGYVFSGRDEALPYAETVPGASTEELAGLCRELGVYVILGLLEKAGDKLFNTAVLIGAPGLIGRYRKTHLPYLGVDRFVDAGDGPFPVFQTDIGNIGLHICYDIVFPETSRVMALTGADILALPANFPQGRGEKVINHIVSARAIENRVHLVAVNRVGSERNASFAGMSKIADASGETLAQASPDKEEIIYAEVDTGLARQKHLAIIPGQYELDYEKDRRPELYGRITQTPRDGDPPKRR